MSIESTEEYTLPSNPKDRLAIKHGVEEIKAQLIIIESAKEQIKAITERLKEELEVPPKIAKRFATVSLKDDMRGNEFEKIVNESESFAINYETLFRASDSTPNEADEEEDIF